MKYIAAVGALLFALFCTVSAGGMIVQSVVDWPIPLEAAPVFVLILLAVLAGSVFGWRSAIPRCRALMAERASPMQASDESAEDALGGAPLVGAPISVAVGLLAVVFSPFIPILAIAVGGVAIWFGSNGAARGSSKAYVVGTIAGAAGIITGIAVIVRAVVVAFG